VKYSNKKAVDDRKDDRAMCPIIGYSTVILFTPTTTTLRGFDSERI